MDLLDWVVRGLVGVLLLAFINEKTRRHKMSDQFMTAEEVTARCVKCHSRRDKERDREMSHFQELVEKELAYGRERFKGVEKRLDEASEALIKVSENIAGFEHRVMDLIRKTNGGRER